MLKIAVIGAGSEKFGGKMIVDLLMSKELQEIGTEIWIVDENAEAADRMMKFAERLREHVGSNIALEQTTDRLPSLEGAKYVITAVARRRWDLWEQDFRVPLSYGFGHVLGENGGPGALFHALRSFETVLPICEDIERICPDALLLNFTNPEARVLHAICHLTKVRAVGLCHGFYGALHPLAKYLGCEPEQL